MYNLELHLYSPSVACNKCADTNLMVVGYQVHLLSTSFLTHLIKRLQYFGINYLRLQSTSGTSWSNIVHETNIYNTICIDICRLRKISYPLL